MASAPPPTFNPLLVPGGAGGFPMNMGAAGTAPEPEAPAAAPSKPVSTSSRPWFALDLPNPGIFEHLHQDVKYSLAKFHVIDGARVIVQKPVSNNFQVSHTINMGAMNNYHFGTTFVGEPKNGMPEMSSPILISDVDNDGNFSAQMHFALTPQLKAKVIYQRSQKDDNGTVEMDYRGKDFTVSAKAINPDIVNETGVWYAAYFQSITQRIALGAECIYQYHNGIEEAAISMGGRYKSDRCQFDGTLTGQGGVNLSYLHKVDEKVSLMADFEGNIATKDGTGSVGYQYDLRQNAVRGQIDSKGSIYGILENKLAPGLSFTLTGMINHMTGKSAFGMGFFLG